MMDILVVCTGNICRSPMAEGLLRHMLAGERLTDIQVRSAGTHGLDGEPAAAFAIEASAQIGVDIADHRARSLDREMVSGAGLILVMEPFQQEIVARALPASNRHQLRLLADFETPRQSDTIDDPYRQSLKVYQTCLKRIWRCLEGVVLELKQKDH